MEDVIHTQCLRIVENGFIDFNYLSLVSQVKMSEITSVIDFGRVVESNYITWTVADIVRRYKLDNTGRLRLPASQRLFAKQWNSKKKSQDFIDSIVHGYPIGSLILEKCINDNDDIFYIYDGRHRAEKLYDYANNKFKYNGKLYSELSVDDRRAFNERKIPVVEMTFRDEISAEVRSQIRADIFTRLNSGVKLSDSDYYYANIDSKLVSATMQMLNEYGEQLSELFGGIDIHNRKDLANWTGLVYGLSQCKADVMTTSYVRISEHINEPVNQTNVHNGIKVLIELYKRANERYVLNAKALQEYRKLGLLNAFFFAEWFQYNQSRFILDKWIDIIGRLRNATTSVRMRFALKTSGAQNLNIRKITDVLKQVNDYLGGRIELPSSDDEFDDEDDE
jgi:hypothetical protein